MDFDFKSSIEDESVEGLQPNAILLILGVAALFILLCNCYIIII